MAAAVLALKSKEDQAHDALLDAFAEVSLHHESPEEMTTHMGEILRSDDWEVLDEDIQIIDKDGYPHPKAFFWINGRWLKIIA